MAIFSTRLCSAEDGYPEVFAINLRKQRQAKGFSQEELAHLADIDRTYISSLERCLYAAGIDVVDKLAKAMDVEAADLLRRPVRRRSTS